MNTADIEKTVAEIWDLFRETDKEFKELRELFTGQWGKLNGLFVLTLSGENTVVILNDEKFTPIDFS